MNLSSFAYVFLMLQASQQQPFQTEEGNYEPHYIEVGSPCTVETQSIRSN